MGWAFAPFAASLSSTLDVPIVEEPAAFNYVLGVGLDTAARCTSFIPVPSIMATFDKRVQARRFAAAEVPTPETTLAESLEQARRAVRGDTRRWVLKFPTGAGGVGHRFLDEVDVLPPAWPAPLLVQEFIPMPDPMVHRLYVVDSDVFGWVRRRFVDRQPSPWVAHATGAVYELAGTAPPQAIDVAIAAFDAMQLTSSFGCVDLVEGERGWLALEVGTDGLFRHVDRDVPAPLGDEMQERLRAAFESARAASLMER